LETADYCKLWPRTAQFLLLCLMLWAWSNNAFAQMPEAALDLSGYHQTFIDTFSKSDITAYGPGSKWIAHTPWNGDFGDDVFGNPGPNGPFSFSSNGLSITASKDQTGKWQAGLICSVDKDGTGQQGFSQRYGYFEMRAILPDGAGVWPAFWLIGTDKSKSVSEIDIMEYYGHSDDTYHITEHNWVNGKDVLGAWHVVNVPPGSLTTRPNTFGVLITPNVMTFYLNRVEVWSSPTPPEYRQPMYILANLAIGGGWPFGALSSPKIMKIQDIEVYAANP
jgi:beta-glucanase (GH16 family)